MNHPPDPKIGSQPFGQCSLCKQVWETRAEFLGDPNLGIIGYQVAFTNLAEGFFLFNHSCGTTLARTVGEFHDLYTGPIYADRATGSDGCPEYCLRKSELRACPAQCECAAVREIIQIILRWPKGGARQGGPQPEDLIG
jgi:hypothetical protein